MGKRKYELVPPDGGYGWVIVCASALNNFVVIPLIQSFGLIFKDTFIALGLSATQGSLIININASFGMMIGLVNGPLLNYFGYRKISFAGGFFLFFGVILTSFSYTFSHYLIAYGFVASLGLGLTMSSYSLAVNSYFKEKRSKAIGVSMTITGLGPVVMPQIINLLMQYHAIQGVTLILSAICAHSFIAASLLQPVEWHMKKKYIETEDTLANNAIKEEPDEDVDEEDSTIGEEPRRKFAFKRSVSQVENGSLPYRKNSMVSSKLSINHDIEGAGIYGIDSALGGSVLSIESLNPVYPRRRPSVVSNSKLKTQWWKSASTINLESSVNLFDEKSKKPNTEDAPPTNKTTEMEPIYNTEMSTKKIKKPLWKRFLLRTAKIFDLALLKDPVYVNIMLGMSLAVFAELNFSVSTAFILSDFGLTTSQIATFMSILGVADIILRFLAPYIGDLLKQPPRVMYVLTLMALITTRFGLLISTNYKFLLGVSVLLGFAKGIRTVYMSLVIPTYVPLNRLASASGIQMMVNGVFILIGGPVLGFVRDVTGSYRMCIVIMNCVTLSTIIMWGTEWLIRRSKKKEEPMAISNAQENKLLVTS